jgi:hypothetical protein
VRFQLQPDALPTAAGDMAAMHPKDFSDAVARETGAEGAFKLTEEEGGSRLADQNCILDRLAESKDAKDPSDFSL